MISHSKHDSCMVCLPQSSMIYSLWLQDLVCSSSQLNSNPMSVYRKLIFLLVGCVVMLALVVFLWPEEGTLDDYHCIEQQLKRLVIYRGCFKKKLVLHREPQTIFSGGNLLLKPVGMLWGKWLEDCRLLEMAEPSLTISPKGGSCSASLRHTS